MLYIFIQKINISQAKLQQQGCHRFGKNKALTNCRKHYELQHKTQYSRAQYYRSQYEACKNYILERNLTETDSNYKRDIQQSNKARNTELLNCGKYWNQKMRQYAEQCIRMFKELDTKHQQRATSTRLQMEEELSTVVKQSNQLINLRKMEAHAAKQKNFVQAHSIQQKVNKLYEKQRIQWMEGRQKTIQQALKNLRNKQKNLIQGIQRRIKLAQQDYSKDRFMDEQHINQKYDNNLKQLKAKYQREVLSLYGQLRNLGGKSPTKKKKSSVQKSEQKSVSNQTQN